MSLTAWAAGAMTAGSSQERIRENLDSLATVSAAAWNLAASPEAHCKKTSSGRRLRPTRSHWKASQALTLAARAGSSSLRVPAKGQGLKKVFS